MLSSTSYFSGLPSPHPTTPHPFLTVPGLAFVLGGHLLSLPRRLEEHWLASRTLALDGDGLHVHNVFRVLLQVPECARAGGGVHLLDEAQHPHVLLLPKQEPAQCFQCPVTTPSATSPVAIMGSPGYHAKPFADIILLMHSTISADILISILQKRRLVEG